jgi:DNA polymerase III delta subunit
MTAITLRNIPPELQEVIQRRAETDGLSLNRTVIRMLEEAAGQRTATTRELHDDLDHLAGSWPDEEAAAFESALVEQRRVDPELWG